MLTSLPSFHGFAAISRQIQKCLTGNQLFATVREV
jgi:hypothetical protein